MKNKISNGDNLEKELDLVRNNGGFIRVDKDPRTKFVNSLWIQTKSMKESMARIKPTVFQSDTTFSTNREGYKLMIPTYHNTVNNKTEFAGLLFLATETKENIEVGLQFFKDSIDYTSASKLIFVDKVVAWSCSMKH